MLVADFDGTTPCPVPARSGLEGFGHGQAYLPGTGVNADQQGRSPRARPFHCTSVGLTPAITPNVGDSGAAFMVVGDCVRAIPFTHTKKIKFPEPRPRNLTLGQRRRS